MGASISPENMFYVFEICVQENKLLYILLKVHFASISLYLPLIFFMIKFDIISFYWYYVNVNVNFVQRFI